MFNSFCILFSAQYAKCNLSLYLNFATKGKSKNCNQGCLLLVGGGRWRKMRTIVLAFENFQFQNIYVKYVVGEWSLVESWYFQKVYLKFCESDMREHS